MDRVRREFFKLAGKATAAIGCAMVSSGASAAAAPTSSAGTVFDVRSFGAVGDGKAIDSLYFCGEALYAGKNMGTVEAALTSGLETTRSILGLSPM